MEDVNISKYRAQVIRQGSTPASPGFVVSEGQNPVDPSGSGQNHLPVTIATASTGLSITDAQVLGGAGTVGQYIRGDGSLADFPATTGGGSSVSYYLNGSVSQGTIGGVAYKELNRTPIFGAGTDISINADGYIASFITDALDPNKLLIPAGNWNFETYFSASSSGGSPSFYVELYKYNGTTFTLIASSSGTPELIAFGTNINPYFSTLAVPETVLALTDRLALRYYVTHSGRTITLHTENGHLCEVITTFTTGLTALNGLTNQVQFFAVGTSGTDFAISSVTDTHTFNLPTASATNRGALSSADWSMFNAKENAITAGTTAQYFRGDKTFQTLNTAAVPELTNLYYTEARVNANTNVAANTAARHNAVTLGTANGLSLSTQVLSLGLASAGVTGALSGTDWSTFNGKQNALTNPVTGTGTSGRVAFWNGTNSITSDADLLFDGSNLTVGGNITLTNGANRYVRIGSSTAYYYDLQTTGDDFQIIEAGTTPRLTIKYPNGNVGIGTSSPGNFNGLSFASPILDVAGSIQIKGIVANGVAALQFGGDTYRKGLIYSAIGLETPYLAFGIASNGSSSSASEVMRFNSSGFLKASNTGVYASSTGTFHELITSITNNNIVYLYNTAASPYGPYVRFSGAAPNNGTNYYFYCDDTSAARFIVYSNGGISNYQANNTNLSDERTKKEIKPLESYWNKFKAIEIVKFKYKDQTHDDFNIGVIAQQVEKVAPEFVDVDGWNNKTEGNKIISNEEPIKSIYTADLHHTTIKVLQEAMDKIESMQKEIDTLKN